MKGIDFKSVAIGFLLCACMLLITGLDNNDHSHEHTHTTNDITFNKYGFANYGSLKKKIKEMEEHAHYTKDIKYDKFDYASYGSLQKKIKEMENHSH